MPDQIAIQDANIMIDLIKTGLFGHCLAMKFTFMTTDMVLDELYPEQINFIRPHINSGKFTVVSTSEAALIAILKMSEEDQRISEQDWSAIYIAQEKDAILLTGDNRLRTVAELKGLQCCGILWVLDQLVDTHILTVQQACGSLRLLMSVNKRLPEKACIERVNAWCG